MVAHAEGSEQAADQQFVVTRDFDAPRELVFRAWTDPDQFARWFGPRGVTIQVRALEPAPGGVIHFAHQFPDGQSLCVKGVFREVVPQTRLLFTMAFVDAEGRPARHPNFPDWPLGAVFTTLVTLADDGQGTRLTIWQTITPPAAAASEAVKRERPLARAGWAESMDRLAEALTRMREREHV